MDEITQGNPFGHTITFAYDEFGRRTGRPLREGQGEKGHPEFVSPAGRRPGRFLCSMPRVPMWTAKCRVPIVGV